MKNLNYVLLTCLVAFCCTAQAQDTLHAATASQPYKTAIDLQYGRGIGAARVTAKHFFWRNVGLELQATHFNPRQVYHTSLHYVWQPNLFRSERLRPYVGIGPSATAGFYRYSAESQDVDAQYGVSGVVGLEYTFKDVPLALTAEYRVNLLNLGSSQKAHKFQPAGGFFFGGKYIMTR